MLRNDENSEMQRQILFIYGFSYTLNVAGIFNVSLVFIGFIFIMCLVWFLLL